MDGGKDEKRMRLRYAGTCRICGVELPARMEAVYERATRTVRCFSHDVSAPLALPLGEAIKLDAPEVIEPGTAGASARREFEGAALRAKNGSVPSTPNSGA